MGTRAVAPWLVILSLALSACGGGGGGGPPPIGNEILDGQYHAAGITGPGSGLVLYQVTATWGVAAFDGIGTMALSAGLNRDGNVTPEGVIAPAQLVYVVDPDRSVRILDGADELARGRVAADGRLVLLGQSRVDSGPGILVCGLREGVHDGAALAGTWRLVAFAYGYTPDAHVAVFGTATFATDGTGSMTTSVNHDALVSAPSITPLEYYVFADGGILLEAGGTDLFQGGLVRGGNVLVLAGGTDASDDPALLVFVRDGSVPTAASLAGSWSLATFGYDVGSAAFYGLYGDVSADTSGNLDATLSRNHEGVITSLAPVTGSWGVDAAGEVTLTWSGGEQMVGGAAPGNDFVAVAGATAPGRNPTVFFFLR